MPPETCVSHTELVANIAVMKNDISYIRSKVCKHVEEGEKEGGFRDRLLLVEQEADILKKAMWVKIGVAGMIGGLIGGRLAPEVINLLVKVLLK